MKDWIQSSCAQYLSALYMQEHPGPMEQSPCALCHTATPKFICADCTQGAFLCQSCLLQSHNQLPFHRVKMWEGQMFKSTSLAALGLVLAMGHNGKGCQLVHSSAGMCLCTCSPIKELTEV